jgi:glutamyl-tRNA synthetase
MDFAQFEAEFNACVAALDRPPRLRLAPTPSGFLHAGNQLNFEWNAKFARLHPEGRLLLRIDDLDNARKRPEYVQNVFDTLQFMGIQPDEGPVDPLDFEQHWSQTLRMPLYHAALGQLREAGHLFACGLSRSELAQYSAWVIDRHEEVAWSVGLGHGR